jgi:hypothetical protein
MSAPSSDAPAAAPAKLQRYGQLTAALREMEVRQLVEVGTWNGNRARELIGAALRNSSHVTYQGFDLFELLTDTDLEEELSKRPPSREDVASHLQAYRRLIRARSLLTPWRRRDFDFDLHQGYTRDTLPAFREAQPAYRADFVFIDGGHKVETIANDWEHTSKLLAPTGAIFLDDFYDNEELAEEFGCNQLIASLEAAPEWEPTVLPAADHIPGMGAIRIVKVTRAAA